MQNIGRKSGRGIEGFEKSLGLGGSIEVHYALLKKFCAEAGFRHVSYFDCMAYGGVDARYMSNVPEAWWDHYRAEGFEAEDPAVAATYHAATPFFWNDLKPTATALGRRCLEDAEGAGLGNGLVLPIRTRHDELFALVVAGRDEQASIDLVSDLFLVAHMFHAAASALLILKPALHLTPRQTECLTLAAEGKTMVEVGVIIGVTTKTVESHVKGAFDRLGTHTIAQAVAMARAYNLIAPQKTRPWHLL